MHIEIDQGRLLKILASNQSISQEQYALIFAHWCPVEPISDLEIILIRFIHLKEQARLLESHCCLKLLRKLSTPEFTPDLTILEQLPNVYTLEVAKLLVNVNQPDLIPALTPYQQL